MNQPNVIPLKVGFFGEQGTGKTTTAALLAAALSKEVHDGAPVFVTDPEKGWQFVDRIIFQPEEIKLVQRTVPTFKGMIQDLREAERSGCVWAVEMAKIYIELVRTVQAQCGDRWGMELSSMWTDFVNEFLNSRVHCLALSRVADLTEEVLNEQGRLQRIKIAEGMKAGGQRNNFAYEPHLVVRMTLERKPRRKNGKDIEGEGRMIHRADILKDRTWELNGKVIRWLDKTDYKPGGYAPVWTSLLAHYRAMQLTADPQIDTHASSADLIDPSSGNSEFWERKHRQEALVAEVQASFDLLWGGMGAAEKRIRLLVAERIFGVRTREAREQLELEQIERGLHILQAIEERVTGDDPMPTTEAGVLAVVDAAVEYHDSPGRNKTITEILLERSIPKAMQRASA